MITKDSLTHWPNSHASYLPYMDCMVHWLVLTRSDSYAYWSHLLIWLRPESAAYWYDYEYAYWCLLIYCRLLIHLLYTYSAHYSCASSADTWLHPYTISRASLGSLYPQTWLSYLSLSNPSQGSILYCSSPLNGLISHFAPSPLHLLTSAQTKQRGVSFLT